MEDSGDSERIAEAREGERAAARYRERARALADLLGEAIGAGDEVVVVSGSHRFIGVPTAAAGDHAVLEADERKAIVNLEGPVHFERIPAPVGGATNDRSHGSFLARMRTLELQGADVEAVASSGIVRGRVRTTARDHLVLEAGGTELVVPLGSIAFVSCDCSLGG